MERVSKSDVADLLRSIERYNPGNLSVFCTYIKQTCQDQTYDIEAYLAVLKLFQFNPHMFDLATTRVILLKALTSLPNNDFSLCLYLLAEEHHQQPEIVTLVEMYNSLESCLFEDVWEYLAQEPDILKGTVRTYGRENEEQYTDVKIEGFESRIRQFAAHVIQCTYQVVKTDVVTKMLGGLTGSLLRTFCESHGWKLQGDEIYVAPQEDIVKSKNIVESIRFDNLVPIMVAQNKPQQ